MGSSRRGGDLVERALPEGGAERARCDLHDRDRARCFCHRSTPRFERDRRGFHGATLSEGRNRRHPILARTIVDTRSVVNTHFSCAQSSTAAIVDTHFSQATAPAITRNRGHLDAIAPAIVDAQRWTLTSWSGVIGAIRPVDRAWADTTARPKPESVPRPSAARRRYTTSLSTRLTLSQSCPSAWDLSSSAVGLPHRRGHPREVGVQDFRHPREVGVQDFQDFPAKPKPCRQACVKASY